ncbi:MULTISPECIES: cysteine hydrolase family protein [Trichocoleus]|uniref:Cysteine hydrolase n=1 Tax=Trichocoleus desertorum GB2-A4 TaxID=2933944 RepID=A0ABV0JAX4_9CYAN|nr:isochorismatase family cysteine hydrolase [Trichocoleus sp. FACHB-46]MBD1863167.1 cysteine hydrolase [Trichocoleus sp. FACHB-46]
MTLQFNPQTTALICIDFQTGVFTGEGGLPHVGTTEVLPKAKQVLAAARAAKMPIIHFKEIHRKEMVDFGRELDGAEPIHCLETWPSTDYYCELAPIEGEFAIGKRRYSCFFGTDLEILLRGLKVDTLILMGTMTNVCVHYTAAEAHHRDYHFHVIEDCCAGSDWEAHWAALKAMAYLQRSARIKHDEFIQAARSTSPTAIA